MDLQAFQDFLKTDRIYLYDQIPDVLREVRKYFRFVRYRKDRYFNVPCSFDIETSSFYAADGEKSAIMYAWTLGIYGLCVMGRTWDEFYTALEDLADELCLTPEKRLIIYVHNLGFEFQFMRKHFLFEKVFSVKNRAPVYAITDRGIEFRCSYTLSGYNLAKVADNLQTVEIRKLSGDLDYELIRHAKTPLMPREIAYMINDAKIVMAYVAERIMDTGSIAKIPLTKTGYVRTFCRNACFYTPGVPKKQDKKRIRFRDIITGMNLDPEEYEQLKRAFQGGFTHAGAFWSGRVAKDVRSYDFVSSYPAVMLAEQYPMTSAEMVDVRTVEDLRKNFALYCCIFDVQFIGLRSRVYFENYLSISRCYGARRAVINNGRVVSADQICTTITEQDFMIMEFCYAWDEIRIVNFRRYQKGYLPTDFVRAILSLYKDKTTLKGVDGKEAEYLHAKEMLNSCYGMCVTDIVRDEITYDGEWGISPVNVADAITKYNKSWNRFLFYPWGVWVTAYARRNLWTGIKEFAGDYIYSDTDSIKVVNADAHTEYINEYNRLITESLRRAMEYHDIDPAETAPETIKGVKKPLGVWEEDGEYSQFKTLGAKRYMVEYKESGKINITVSGLNKKVCAPYLIEKYGEDVFDAFTDHLYVPPDYTGKMTHTYIDEERRGVVTDYRGTPCEYTELSSVHLEKADYDLSISREYADYLSGIRGID